MSITMEELEQLDHLRKLLEDIPKAAGFAYRILEDGGQTNYRDGQTLQKGEIEYRVRDAIQTGARAQLNSLAQEISTEIRAIVADFPTMGYRGGLGVYTIKES